MAKSIRSKWRRKCLREKRVRYGKKELASLLTLVEKAKEGVEVKDASEVVKAARKRTEQHVNKAVKMTKPSEKPKVEEVEMTPSSSSGELDNKAEEMNPSSSSEELSGDAMNNTSLRALIKKFGNIPKWVHPRKAKKIQKKKKMSKGKKPRK